MSIHDWPLNRRRFLAAASTAIASAGLGLTPSRSVALPLRSRRPVLSFGPELVAAETLRALARRAIEAATAAGATYADIRVADRRLLLLKGETGIVPSGRMDFEYSYGIRVMAGGGSAFTYGADPTPDGIVAAAQQAVRTAQGIAKSVRATLEFASAPVVTGEWSTPFDIDPFAISPDEHAFAMNALNGATGRTRNASLDPAFQWSLETRVFASSEGTLTTQRFAQFLPDVKVRVHQLPRMSVALPCKAIMPRAGGFECVSGSTLQESIGQEADRMQQYLGLPEGHVPLGRYRVVADGTTMAAIAGQTLVPALELSRAAGHEANGAGTSFLSPIANMLGQQLFSSRLSLVADGAPSHYNARRWDDEGVPVEPFTLVQQGKVLDYFATRSTTPLLREWYTASGWPIRPHGTALSWRSMHEPVGVGGAVRMMPDASGGSLEEMVAQTQRGVLVLGLESLMVNPGLSTGTLHPWCAFEIQRGKLVKRLPIRVQMRFSSTQLWNKLEQAGNATSMRTSVQRGIRAHPWAATTQVLEMPAGIFETMDVSHPDWSDA
jgi:TldD protein